MSPGKQAHKAVVTAVVKLSGCHGAGRGLFPKRGFMASLPHLLPSWPGHYHPPPPLPAYLQSFRMDWLDLLAVQGILKSLLQHHSSKASILWRLDFFTVHLSYLDLTTGKP